MSIFGSILDRIFHHSTASTAQATSPQQAGTAAPQSSAQQSQVPTAGTTTGTPRLQSVDVDAVLSQVAAKKGGGGNWRTSIVDLLKLLDLDSSLAARKTLAGELDVHAGADGSAEQNIALQKAVMAKLAENGGKVPDSLRH
jgi:hypothetical protein